MLIDNKQFAQIPAGLWGSDVSKIESHPDGQSKTLVSKFVDKQKNLRAFLSRYA